MKRETPVRDKNHFLERVRREMDEDLGALDLAPAEALQRAAGRHVSAWIERRSPVTPRRGRD